MVLLVRPGRAGPVQVRRGQIRSAGCRSRGHTDHRVLQSPPSTERWPSHRGPSAPPGASLVSGDHQHQSITNHRSLITISYDVTHRARKLSGHNCPRLEALPPQLHTTVLATSPPHHGPPRPRQLRPSSDRHTPHAAHSRPSRQYCPHRAAAAAAWSRSPSQASITHVVTSRAAPWRSPGNGGAFTTPPQPQTGRRPTPDLEAPGARMSPGGRVVCARGSP